MATRGMITGALLALVILSCKKKEEAPVTDAAPPPSVFVQEAPAPRSPKIEHPHVEAVRAIVTKDDPWLAPHLEEIKAHFGGTVLAKMSVQKVEAGRKYVLVDGDKPMLLVIEPDGKLAWKRDNPAAGITPPVGPIALASGPKGRIATAICDPPTKWTALRITDDEGFPFADLQALQGPCEALGLFYWQHHGWLLTSAKANELTKVQLITEDAKMPWGPEGKTLGARWRSLGVPSLARDAKGSFMWIQMAGIESDPDEILAYRFDEDGVSLWPKAAKLGPYAKKERLTLEWASEGVIRVLQANADVMSNGTVKKR